MDSEEDIKIKQELHEEVTCEDNEGALMDVSVSNGSVKLEDKVKKELREDFGNESDDNTEYLCEQCKTYFPYLSSLQLHMQNNDHCDENIDVKSSNDSVIAEAIEASVKGNYTEKLKNKQDEKCNKKKTKRKRQRTEEKDDEIDSKKDEHENDKRELVNLIMKDHIILRKRHHDGIVDNASIKSVKEETENINENNNDELVNLVMKDHIILRINNHGEKIIAMKTEASEETSRDSMCGKSNDETSDGNNKMNNELCETRHDTIMNVIGDAYDDSNKENASKRSNNTKRRKVPITTKPSKEHGTQNIPSESSHMSNQFDCNPRKKSYKASKKLKTHVNNSRKRGVSCDLCKKTFTRRDNLARHVKRFHLNAGETKNIPSPNQKHVCTLCDKSFETRKKLMSHFYNAHKTVSCDTCPRKFSRKDRLAEHVMRVHLAETDNIRQEPITSPLLGHGSLSARRKVIDTETDNIPPSKNHRSSHKSYERPSAVCDICSKTLGRQDSLAEHVKRIHMGLKKKYVCKFCEKKYFDLKTLNRHKTMYCTKVIKKIMTCKLCTNKFVNQKKFEMHMADHPRFICDYCEKMYYVRYYLQKHIIKKHLNLNIVKIMCKLCGKKFKSQKTLELHMADHPELICDHCDKIFYKKYHLQMHIESKHMNLNVTKVCKLCSKKYVSQKTFEMHMADHPKFICDLCDKMYYLKYCLLRHITKKHLNVR